MATVAMCSIPKPTLASIAHTIAVGYRYVLAALGFVQLMRREHVHDR
jgi:hypothetical protein